MPLDFQMITKAVFGPPSPFFRMLKNLKKREEGRRYFSHFKESTNFADYSMNLIVDIGNSVAKLTVMCAGEPTYATTISADGWAAIEEIAQRFPLAGCAAVCVGSQRAVAEKALRTLPCPVLWVTGNTPSPLVMSYETPQTLGADRLAAAVGAWVLFPGRELLVVDAGTCITYDRISGSGQYLGGNISPGKNMRLEALHTFTAALPRVAPDCEILEIGKDTPTAIMSGVEWGIRFEVEGYIRKWKELKPGLQVVLTGGGAASLATYLGLEVKTDAYLIARGLDKILDHQTEPIF